MKFKQAAELAVKLSAIKRTVGYRPRHLENDSEHSYQLALAAWSANQQYNLKLNEEKILKFALVHDLVEIYAGDVDAHGSKKKILGKKTQEQKSLQQLKSDYPELTEIWNAVDEYELKNTLESRLVHTIDKLIAELNTYTANRNYYIKRKVTFENWLKWFYQKIDYETLDPKIKNIFDETISEVTQNHQNIFYTK
jgi:5'-deoxynucleotidase YfbR-like HD superfamily hydrolase